MVLNTLIEDWEDFIILVFGNSVFLSLRSEYNLTFVTQPLGSLGSDDSKTRGTMKVLLFPLIAHMFHCLQNLC